MDTELQLAGGYIETFAGNGKARSTGDGKRAVKAGIPLPHHAALDKDEQREVLAAQQEAQFARQQAMLAKEEAFIARFKARARRRLERTMPT